MMRVFLDANILFSAAYRQDSGIVRLWRLTDVTLITSQYALEEATRNLAISRPESLDRLSRLTSQLVLNL
jgi:uncharacterized protein